MNKGRVATAIFCLAISGSAFSSPVCHVPKERWISEAEVKLSLWKEGYSIKTFSISNGCYLVSGLNKNGNHFELYIDPSDGAPIDEKN